MPEPDKHTGGRPTKLTEDFLAAMFDVIHDEDNALIYTDEELLSLINDKLPLEARICGDTFSLWKNGKIADDARGVKFFSVYKKALMKQKASLFKRLDDPKNPSWQKEAWKIERKFDDWNIKHKVGVTKLPEDGAAALASVLLGAHDVADVSPNPGPGPTEGDSSANGPGVS